MHFLFQLPTGGQAEVSWDHKVVHWPQMWLKLAENIDYNPKKLHFLLQRGTQ